MSINESLRGLVRDRADNRCEYCCLHQEDSPLAALHVEHIVPRKHGGSDDSENLALACIDCNLHKGPNLTGIDPLSNAITALFNPREDIWHEHFEWEGMQVSGKTDIGRTTVRVLEMNSDEQIGIRLS